MLELENGLARDERMIYVPALDGTLDVTLSLTCDTMPLLAQVPMQLTLAEHQQRAVCAGLALAARGRKRAGKLHPAGHEKFCPSSWRAYALDLTAEFLEGCRTGRSAWPCARSSFAERPAGGRDRRPAGRVSADYRDDSLQAVHTARTTGLFLIKLPPAHRFDKRRAGSAILNAHGFRVRYLLEADHTNESDELCAGQADDRSAGRDRPPCRPKSCRALSARSISTFPFAAFWTSAM